MKSVFLLPALILPALAALQGCGGGGTDSGAATKLTLLPEVAVLARDASQSFGYSIETTGSADVLWSTTGGSITQTGVYKAPAIDGIFDVVVTSVQDSSVSDRSLAVVGDNNSGEITPLTLAMGVGETVDVSVAFTGPADQTATWLSTGGKVVSSGASTAKVTAPDSPTTINVIGRSTASPSLFGKRVIQVRSITVAVTPDGNTVAPGTVRAFAAAVTGANNADVSWSASGGTIDATGSWTAPATPGTYTITATSVANSKFKGEALVFVAAP